ncbi:uncharacterized protein LOC142231303 [Haematobia irritans]|uniref:uncharacterized protein LOC142231303 n=1 Tax=Haematobia irritans TaxID=7368 RepID=UPI003F4FF89D
MTQQNKEEITTIENTLKQHVSDHDYDDLQHSAMTVTYKIGEKIKETHKKKVNRLKQQQMQQLNIKLNEGWFVNKTKQNFPDDVKWLLSLGEKFGLPTTKEKFPLINYIADGEELIQTILEKEEQEIARTNFTTTIDNHTNKTYMSSRDKYIQRTVDQTKQFLKKNNNIMITNADKGNVTVAIEKSEYKERMMNIPGDMMTYQRWTKDPTINCVVNILKNITQNSKYNIRDSVQFRNKIKDLTTEEDEKIVSFDVISLFPSIPVELALTIIEQRWDEIKEFTKMTQNTFLRILKFCIMENRYFQFEEKIYKQKKGLPMGSPASPIVADIVMEKLLMDCENKLTTKPKILLKYVDDLFAVTHKNEIMNMLNTLNNFHSNIKFTVEEEDNGQLPYLDTLVIRKNGKLNLDWYQKPTASGRIINFYSKHPKRIIINTANNLIHRVLTISDKEFHAKNKERIKQILAKNNFPKYLANNLINSKKNNKEFNEHQTKTKSYKSLTYIPNVSERIENSNKEKFTIAHKTNNTLKGLFTNPKTKLPNMEKHNLVYEIKCDGNDQQSCEKVYVGTTGNKLKTRIAGHKSDYKLRGNNIIQKTALANHCATQKHIPNFDNVRILARESNYNKRFTQEMLHIINTPSEKRINYKADIEGNAKSYRQLIEKRKKMKRTQKTHRRKQCNIDY